MMFDKEKINKFKSLINNKRRIWKEESYFIDGKPATKETFLFRKSDGAGYVVGHDDYLDIYIDLPALYFTHKIDEFESFENALNFIVETYSINLEGNLTKK